MSDVHCPAPTCRALPGEPCISLQGNPRQVSHKSRRNAASLASTSCPKCGARRGHQCTGVRGIPLKRVHQERRETAASVTKTVQEIVLPDTEWWLDKIHCGDVLDTLAAMPDECCDLVITSPPYNALQTTGGGWRHGLGKWGKAPLLTTGYDTHSDRMDPDDYVAWQQDCLRAMMRVVKPEGAILYNHRPRVQGGPLRGSRAGHRSGGQRRRVRLAPGDTVGPRQRVQSQRGVLLAQLRGDLPAGQAGQVPPPGPRPRTERLAGAP